MEKEKLAGTCFNKGNLVGIAKCLLLCGFSPIPMIVKEDINGLRPSISWRHYQEKPMSLSEIKIHFQRAHGIAYLCGRSSSILVLDVNDLQKFNQFYDLEKLKAYCGFVIRSNNRGQYLLGFRYDEEFFKCENLSDEAGFKLKSNGTLATFFTVLPGLQYKPEKLEGLKPLPQDLRKKIKNYLLKKN